MRKIISLFISILIACSINGLDNAFKSELPTFEEEIKSDNIIEDVQEDTKVEEESELFEEPKEEETKSSVETEKEQEVISEDSTLQKETIIEKEPKKIVETPKVNESLNQTQPSNDVKQEQNIVQENKQTQSKKNNPWDSLGITEYEFYNTPAHSWAKLDFKISEYGSREATFNACNDYGNKYKTEHGGGFECLPVNSYSGDYIGEMIEFY